MSWKKPDGVADAEEETLSLIDQIEGSGLAYKGAQRV
jgi:hypothetical protein